MESSPVQKLFIVRHGERLDNVDYRWTYTAKRPYDPPLTEKGAEQARDTGPYDPPLTEKGAEQARDTGKKFLGKEVQCIVSSPFLRCLQTAQEMSTVLGLPGLHTCNAIVDVLNSHCGINEQPLLPPPDVAQLGINISVGDTSELPRYPESTRNGLKRYSKAYTSLANSFWPKNLIIVTHGYGVQQAIVKGGRSDDVFVDYCGFVELTRSSRDSDKWTVAHSDNIDEYS